MKNGQILFEKPTERHQRVKIVIYDSQATILPFGNIISDLDMSALRKNGTDPKTISVNTKNKLGHVFANLGISAIINITIDNDRKFLMMPRRGETGTKLLSGYIPVEDQNDPIKVLFREVDEEILLITSDELAIGHGQPFGQCLTYSDEKLEITCSLSKTMDLDSFTGDIWHNGQILSHGPMLMFHASSNSAQLIYSLYINFSSNWLERLGIGLHHTEDRRTNQEPDGHLQTIFHEHGMLLVELKNNRLTENVFIIKDGVLNPFSMNGDNIILSEAFAPKHDFVAVDNSILLSQFVTRQ